MSCGEKWSVVAVGDQDQVGLRSVRRHAVGIDVDGRAPCSSRKPEWPIQSSALSSIEFRRFGVRRDETGERMSHQTVIWSGTRRCCGPLNRPDSLNAWIPQLGHELKHVVEVAAADPLVRAVLITGAGRAFSGADLKAGFDADPDDGGPDVRKELHEGLPPGHRRRAAPREARDRGRLPRRASAPRFLPSPATSC